MIKAAGNTELCELLDVEPKAQCEVCPVVLGPSASSTARAVTSYEMIRPKTRSTSSQFLTSFSIHHYCIRIRSTTRSPIRKERRGSRISHCESAPEEMQEEREFLSVHGRFIRDARFRKTMIELGRTEEVIREMDKLANEDPHTPCYRRENSMYTVAIGGYVRILLVLTRCP